MNKPRQLILIRHGESARNKAKDGKGTTYFADEEARKTVKGIPDHEIPLTEEGHRQAERTGAYMRERFGAPDFIYHSGYKRTVQTTEGMLSAFSKTERRRINVRMNPFIRERDPGWAYDMTQAEAEAAFPWLHEYWKTFGGFFAVPPGGESICQVVSRVRMFYEALKRSRAGESVWICTHGGTIRAFRSTLERWSYQQALAWPQGQSPKNCGITVYEYDRRTRRLALREYNTVAPFVPRIT
ncbi:MAG: histidine phosphatase family protein [Patescibacteria group bacterium]|nr:histidine phosphatase family protein [Patescibacteria group bacterium]MDE2116470.1 histidine phosphatase family protein [Patescibacteria group bacterium]